MLKGITIIIPTYNREDFIEECIKSVLQQRINRPMEIIVSDDGSTDKTMKILNSYSDRVKIILRTEDSQTRGAAAARNRGLWFASQEYISFLDSDDIYLPGHLNKMISAIEANDQYAFAFCRTLELRTENGLNLFRPWTHREVLKNDIKNPVVSRSKIVHTNSFIFKKEVFDHVGLFNENYSNGEDGDQWMRISEQYKGVFTNHYGAAYRTSHGESQLTKNSNVKKNREALIIFQNAEKRYYDLKLRDTKRIFSIKYTLLLLRYLSINKKPIKFQIYFRILILKYPLGYFKKLKIKRLEKSESKRPYPWKQLNFYIEQKTNVI